RWDLRQEGFVRAMLGWDFPNGPFTPERFHHLSLDTMEVQSWQRPRLSMADFLEGLLRCCARVLASARGADLCFVGRSLDSVFDPLCGLLRGTSWEPRLTLLPLSLHRAPDWALRTAARRRALRAYLQAQGWAPEALARREHPVALTDLVSTGETLGGLVE